jgi:MoaA/NifB/PqqE/SkfB family radical SAM enzyme
MSDYDLEYDKIEEVEEPGKTYRIDTENNMVLGTVNDLEAIKQAIYLRLSVEKYEHLIYSWDYGIELRDLFGAPLAFVVPELQRRISEELIKDDRILSVDEFSFETAKGIISVTFTVHTVLGDIEQGMEVSV